MAQSAIRPGLKEGAMYGTAVRVKPKPGTAAALAEEGAEPYSPPVVRIGEVVLWYHESNLGATPHIAYVAAVEGGGQIVVDVIMPGGVTKRKHNVRHYQDERAHNKNMRQWGCWRPVETSLHERVAQLEEALSSVMDIVSELQVTLLPKSEETTAPAKDEGKKS